MQQVCTKLDIRAVELPFPQQRVTRNGKAIEPKGTGTDRNGKFTLSIDQMKWATDPPYILRNGKSTSLSIIVIVSSSSFYFLLSLKA